MLWYAPTVNSYRRIAGGEFSGNGLSWGYDSRMVSCRVLVEDPASTRLEWRVPGADVNPYLAIAGLLASARDGIATGTDPGEPLVGEDWEREVPPLPAHLGEAVGAFRDSAWAARRSAPTSSTTTRRRAAGSGSGSSPPTSSPSGSAAATSR